MTLTEFLLARIAEDEADAQSASPSPWRVTYDEGDFGLTTYDYPSDRVVVRTPEPYDQDHVARWQPSRVLAECEAKRRIVEEVLPIHPDYDPLYVQRLLALPYADHPDYDQSWRL